MSMVSVGYIGVGASVEDVPVKTGYDGLHTPDEVVFVRQCIAVFHPVQVGRFDNILDESPHAIPPALAFGIRLEIHGVVRIFVLAKSFVYFPILLYSMFTREHVSEFFKDYS